MGLQDEETLGALQQELHVASGEAVVISCVRTSSIQLSQSTLVDYGSSMDSKSVSFQIRPLDPEDHNLPEWVALPGTNHGSGTELLSRLQTEVPIEMELLTLEERATLTCLLQRSSDSCWTMIQSVQHGQGGPYIDRKQGVKALVAHHLIEAYTKTSVYR